MPVAPVLQGAAASRRAEIIHKTGFSALASNEKVFFIALFSSYVPTSSRLSSTVFNDFGNALSSLLTITYSIGGFLYGYQQGVLSQALVMTNFNQKFPSVQGSTTRGWLTSILQLGGWVGALSSGISSEVFSRKHTLFVGAMWVVLGSYLMAGAEAVSFLYAGRFFTGLGVGTLFAVGPLYNSELAPPEMRGLLISLQQFVNTFGIMVSYWIGYGTNYIGGTGAGQSDMAWRVPMIIQGIPAIILAIGVWWMPFSPRLLVNKGREAEALKTLSFLRSLPEDHELVQIEFLEIKSESIFERRAFDRRYPDRAVQTDKSPISRELAQYSSLFRTRDTFKRVALASLIMFFQQWTGIDSIIYYASIIFSTLGLGSNTISLLATGVVGIIFFVSTLPTVMFIDKVGRKPLMYAGSVGMFCCMLIVAIIVAKFEDSWATHPAAGWTAVVFIWLYIACFGFSWGPAAWTLIAEIFPLSIRAKGVSIGASSNWMNNFIIALVAPPMLARIKWGTYVFFAVFIFLGGFFIYFFVPETTNKTLEEMDLVFGSHASREDAEALAAIQAEVGLTAIVGSRESEEYEGEKEYVTTSKV